MPAAYRFLDRWVVRAPIDRVDDTIGEVLEYERWWTAFVIHAEGDVGPPEPGKRNELLVKAYLPYKVNFGLEVLEAERPRRIFSRLSKDFDGTGEWTLRGAGRHDGGNARLAPVRQPRVDQVPDAGPPARSSARTTTGPCAAASERSVSTSGRRAAPACSRSLEQTRSERNGGILKT